MRTERMRNPSTRTGDFRTPLSRREWLTLTASEDAALPNFVSIAPYRQFNAGAWGPGFLGPRYAPLLVGDQFNPFANQPGGNGYENALRVDDLTPPDGVTPGQANARIDILQD